MCRCYDGWAVGSISWGSVPGCIRNLQDAHAWGDGVCNTEMIKHTDNSTDTETDRHGSSGSEASYKNKQVKRLPMEDTMRRGFNRTIPRLDPNQIVRAPVSLYKYLCFVFAKSIMTLHSSKCEASHPRMTDIVSAFRILAFLEGNEAPKGQKIKDPT